MVGAYQTALQERLPGGTDLPPPALEYHIMDSPLARLLPEAWNDRRRRPAPADRAVVVRRPLPPVIPRLREEFGQRRVHYLLLWCHRWQIRTTQKAFLQSRLISSDHSCCDQSSPCWKSYKNNILAFAKKKISS